MPRRRQQSPDLIQTTNSKPNDVFIKDHLPPDWSQLPSSSSSSSSSSLRLLFYNSRDLPSDYLEACLSLIEKTSKDGYLSSNFGWKPSAKRAEMRLEGLRYFLLADADNDIPLRGFMSVMPTWEAGLPVLYCYELHLEPELRGLGLGKHLMNLALEVARRIDGINRVMLTCFVSNEHGREFYTRMGFTLDASSPDTRELRDKVIMPGYVILGRDVESNEEGAQTTAESCGLSQGC